MIYGDLLSTIRQQLNIRMPSSIYSSFSQMMGRDAGLDIQSEARSRILELGEYAPAYEVVEVRKVGVPALNRKSWYINTKCHDGKPSETMRVWNNYEDAFQERARFVGGTTFDVVEIQATN